MSFVPSRSMAEVIARMEEILNAMVATDDAMRHFHATYLRTTAAIRDEIEQDGFRDPRWVEAWDVRFADLYLEPLERRRSGLRIDSPWRIAFAAAEGPSLPPLRHVLLGMNTHINFDLPQALIATISDEEFDDPALLARRSTDHARVDEVLVRRVASEDRELIAATRPGERSLLDRLLTPLNHAATRRFIKEAREKVWQNALILSQARREGGQRLGERLHQLGELTTERVADLQRPGQVVLRLARNGFGVSLPRADRRG
jgi:hypothetical protein